MKIVLGDNLRYLRKQRRLTQEQLAKHTQCSRATIGAYEEGRAHPPLGNLCLFANFLA